VLARKRWPAIHFKDKRGITLEEHQKILAGERNAEVRDFYELLGPLPTCGAVHVGYISPN
jgi:hypothetical protein